MALQRFTRRAAEAAKGTGEAKDALAQMGIVLRDQSGRIRATEDLLGDVAEAFKGIEDPAERVRLAFKLFDSEGVAMVNMLSSGADALETVRRRARDLGIVLEEDLVRNAERARDELDTLGKVISANLTRAVLDLAPVIADASGATGGAGQGRRGRLRTNETPRPGRYQLRRPELAQHPGDRRRVARRREGAASRTRRPRRRRYRRRAAALDRVAAGAQGAGAAAMAGQARLAANGTPAGNRRPPTPLPPRTPSKPTPRPPATGRNAWSLSRKDLQRQLFETEPPGRRPDPGRA